MILQCDQCNTKFRLDDSKLKPGGVKVRCSKCRHVFLAGADQKPEESEFDAILSGLGAPAPEKSGETPSPSEDAEQEKAAAHLTAGEVPTAPALPERKLPSAADQPDALLACFSDGMAEPGAEAQASVSQGAPLDEFAFSDRPSQPEEKTAAAPGQEFDFDDFSFEELSGVKAEGGAPAAAGEEGAGEFSFDEEILAKVEKPAVAAAEALDFGEFSFDEEPLLPSDKEATASAEGAGFGDFSFDEEPAAKGEEPAAQAAEALDFGEFSFNEEPLPKSENTAPAAPEALDFGEFSFNEEPLLKSENAAPAAPEALDFGEFSFNEEPLLKGEKAAPAAEDGLDFGELSFSEEPLLKGEKAAPAAAKELDFGEFDFDQENAAKSEQGAPASDALGFGEFSFEEEPTVKGEQAPAAAAEELDFGEFSFEEGPAAKGEEAPPPPVKDEFDLGSFNFDEEPPPLKEEQSGSAPDEFWFSLPERADSDLEESSLSHDLSQRGAEAAAAMAGAAGLAGAAALSGKPGPAAAETGLPPAAEPVSPAKEGGKQQAQDKSLDFDFGPAPTNVPETAEEEELPPLSITSRRKGRSALTVAVVAVCVIVIIALSGAGLYLMQAGPAAFEKFDQLGIGFVADWFGMVSPEEGRIAIRKPTASFYQNQTAGEIFVVTGEAVNMYRKARASIHVKVSLFDKSGKVLLQKTAYCGNRLSPEQLATLPVAKIESIMNNQFGDSLSNLGVKPGQAIGFVVAIANAPKEAADFGVEVVGSTVAGQ